MQVPSCANTATANTNLRQVVSLFWHNGKENGSYRDYRGYITEKKMEARGTMPIHLTLAGPLHLAWCRRCCCYCSCYCCLCRCCFRLRCLHPVSEGSPARKAAATGLQASRWHLRSEGSYSQGTTHPCSRR